MELEPKNLNIPLTKRSWFPLQIGLAAMVVGWLWHRPGTIAEGIVSAVLGGAGVWFFLASPLVIKFGSHRNILVRWITLLFAIVGLSIYMQKVIPYAHSLVR
jgi:hypothetical protein